MQGYKKLLLTTASLILLLSPTFGQNTTSPYSRYGYGILSDQAVGASKGMGGIRYGVRGSSTNPGNPASYSAVDSLTYIFDLGISYSRSTYNDGNTKQNDDHGGLDYVTMQFPVAKKFGMSIGLLPFSSVGYDFGTIQYKNITEQRSFSGSGGFSQVYGGLAYEPIKNLSFGANFSYLFGNTKYNRTLNILNVSTANVTYWYNKLTMNALKMDFGIQYTLTLNDKDNIILGAVFSPRIRKTASIVRYENVVSSTTGLSVQGDTATYTGSNAYADIPNTFGFGFTWNRNKQLTVGADVTYQDWSKVRYSSHMDDNLNESNRFNDRWRINAGMEYTIAPRDRSFVKRMKFRGGFNYSNSYLNVINSDSQVGGYKEYGVTFGLGLPIRDNYSGRTSYININFEYNSLRPELSNMVKEEYYGVSLNVNINELWFLKNRFR